MVAKSSSLSGLRKTKHASSGSCKKQGGKPKQKHQVQHEVVAGESFGHAVVQCILRPPMLSATAPCCGADAEEQLAMLRAFDLTSSFGPCTGMSRRER